MQLLRSRAHWAILLLPAALFAADVTTEGTLTVGGGGALLDGDRPAFQRITQHKKDGFGGIENFRLTAEGQDYIFRFDAKLMAGDDNYRAALRYEKTDRYWVAAGFEQFRVYYDGSSGYFAPSDTSFVLFDEDLSLRRTKLWAEVGAYTANKTLIKLRYERRGRDGTKNSTHWGDTNLTGTSGTRNIVPAFYDLDEVVTMITLDVGNDSLENVKWNVGARYSQSELNNKKVSPRRPYEPTTERMIVTKDQSESDLFAVHGYYARKVNEKLTVSAGALRTNLDTTIRGTRIFGQTYDPVFDPAAVRRQFHDEGYPSLHGDGELKQTVLNLNAVYIPREKWSIRPSVRFENLHQETMSEFVESNVGNAPLFVTALEDLEGEHEKELDEFAEAIEVRYTGKPNWTFGGKAEWIQTSGNLDESLVEHSTALIQRSIDNDRKSQKYSLNANWYAKPGLTFASQYYFKVNTNDYDATADSTPATGGDRYPAFITDQDFETHDVNFRISWRPMPLLGLVTRYDMQQSKINSQEAGLQKVESSKYNSHIISQTATWSPTGRLFLNANVNVTYDQVETPAYAFVQNGDNNYVNGSVGGGYALAKLDDVYFDYNWFRASNFIDNSATSLPYGLSQKLQTASVTWVRRQTEHLIYTLKYSYVTNRDRTWSGLNDFDAHVIYARVQYHF